MPRRPGFLLTVEGVDGSGKSTQVTRISSYLKRAGKKVTLIREPGGTRLSERIRKMLLDVRSVEMTRSTELFLYLAARGQLMNEVIEPALKRDELVLCDRFTDSTLAYQGGGRGFPVSLLRQLNDSASGGRRPDLTLLIDVTLATSRQRKSRTADRLEREKDQFFARVVRGYRKIAREEPRRVIRIDGNKDVEQVWTQIREILDKRLKL